MITELTTKKTYAGNDATTVFSSVFPVFEDAHVVVSTITGGVETVQTSPAFYSLSNIPGVATITTVDPVPSGTTLVIERIVPLKQLVDYINNSAFEAESHEQQMDLIVMMAQQLNAAILENTAEFARFIRCPEGETFAELAAAASRLNRVLYFDAATGAISLLTPTELFNLMPQAANGVPAGGASGYYLRKASGDDYDVEWVALGDSATQDAADLPVSTATQEALDTKPTFLPAVTGYAGGTATDLDSLPTSTDDIGNCVMFLSSSSGLMELYKLRAGTDAEDSPSIIRPDDYAGSTNEVVWERQFTSLPSALSISSITLADTSAVILPDGAIGLDGNGRLTIHDGVTTGGNPVALKSDVTLGDRVIIRESLAAGDFTDSWLKLAEIEIPAGEYFDGAIFNAVVKLIGDSNASGRKIVVGLKRATASDPVNPEAGTSYSGTPEDWLSVMLWPNTAADIVFELDGLFIPTVASADFGMSTKSNCRLYGPTATIYPTPIDQLVGGTCAVDEAHVVQLWYFKEATGASTTNLTGYLDVTPVNPA